MKLLKTIVASCAALMLLGTMPSQAVPLPEAATQQLPDIANTVSDMDYAGAGGDLLAFGASTILTVPGGGSQVVFGDFLLDVTGLTVTAGGTPDPAFAFSGGSLEITDITGATTLASTNLLAIGIDASSTTGQLQLLFTDLTGSAAATFQAVSPLAIVLLNSDIFGTSGNFAAGFADATGSADVASVSPIPLPASGLLLLSAFGGMAWLRRRKMVAGVAA